MRRTSDEGGRCVPTPHDSGRTTSRENELFHARLHGEAGEQKARSSQAQPGWQGLARSATRYPPERAIAATIAPIIAMPPASPIRNF